MSIQSEITRLEAAKSAIAAAIAGKGVTVPDGTMLDGMAALIESIEAGGGKIARGTFIPAKTTSLSISYKIEHNCGFVPDVFIVFKEDSYTYTEYSIRLAVSFPNSFLEDNYVSIDRSRYQGYAYGWTSSSYSQAGGPANINGETTDKVAYIRSESSNNKVVAGTSYIWIAIGVI